MPAPPTEIRIKRKATDDPVELLHVQNEYNGLRQIKQYVFKRQRISTAPNINILNPLNPHSLQGRVQQPATSSTSNQLNTKASLVTEGPVAYRQGLEQVLGSSQGMIPSASTNTSAPQSGVYGVNEHPSVKSKAEPRRFHLSRSPVSPAEGTSSSVQSVKRPRAVFIERRRIPELHDKIASTSIPLDLGLPSQTASTSQHKIGDGESQLPSTENQSRPPAPLRNVKLASGEVVPWDADSATLATQMQAYTMQEIGYNLAKTSTPGITTSTPVIRARQVSSFKAKAPALKHHERHSEQATAIVTNRGSNKDEIMTDAADPDGDDSEYVTETYIRMPAEMFEYEEQKSVGLLVLDSQPDIDEFYNDDSDSDSEIYDEEEDENAENHPSTDYPEDEVESDDEFGRNPYQRYRNRNASDNECDEDDVTYSDDESKPQWARRPWMVNNPYRRNEEHDADDD